MDESYAQYYEMINKQQQANNAWSAEQARKAMDYQTEMSNTAHQREVADLKAAGLNPVLSAGGQGATTGSGHAAQAGNENITALYGLISKSIDAQIKQAEAMKTAAKFSLPSSEPTSITELPWLDLGKDLAAEAAAEALAKSTGMSRSTARRMVNEMREFADENDVKKYLPFIFAKDSNDKDKGDKGNGSAVEDSSKVISFDQVKNSQTSAKKKAGISLPQSDRRALALAVTALAGLAGAAYGHGSEKFKKKAFG